MKKDINNLKNKIGIIGIIVQATQSKSDGISISETPNCEQEYAYINLP
jgi:hypothetical protein